MRLFEACAMSGIGRCRPALRAIPANRYTAAMQALFAEHRTTGNVGACNIWQAAALAEARAADVDVDA